MKSIFAAVVGAGDMIQPPIMTVVAPMTIGAPQPDTSPVRTAGMPPTNTVALPGAIGVGGWGGVPGNEQMCSVPIFAAGLPSISTFSTPGPPIMPGWGVGSPTRAAGGIFLLSCGLAPGRA